MPQKSSFWTHLILHYETIFLSFARKRLPAIHIIDHKQHASGKYPGSHVHIHQHFKGRNHLKYRYQPDHSKDHRSKNGHNRRFQRSAHASHGGTFHLVGCSQSLQGTDTLHSDNAVSGNCLTCGIDADKESLPQNKYYTQYLRKTDSKQHTQPKDPAAPLEIPGTIILADKGYCRLRKCIGNIVCKIFKI